MRYEVVRSVITAGTFDALPQRVRQLGPWQGLSSGEIECLKLHYRLQLTEQGFVLVYQHVATFSAAQR
jgi:hypothetical protein